MSNFAYCERHRYHIMQSKIALGSGGLIGKGFMESTQSRLNFLPEKQTDFIFTLIAEEFGFLGSTLLIFLFFAIILYCFYVGMISNNYFGKVLATGLGVNFALYVFINIGMVSGLLPVVGVPLPLVSYGGTAMMTLFSKSRPLPRVRLFSAPVALTEVCIMRLRA